MIQNKDLQWDHRELNYDCILLSISLGNIYIVFDNSTSGNRSYLSLYPSSSVSLLLLLLVKLVVSLYLHPGRLALEVPRVRLVGLQSGSISYRHPEKLFLTVL